MDGGYYAIKGFAYQFDKFLQEVLASQDDTTTFAIENIQDINSNDEIIQVKYRETQTFSLSKVKEAIINLYLEYLKQPTKNYKLYCYFKSPKAKLPTIDQIQKILISCESFNQKKVEGFYEKFIIINAEEYEVQFSTVIQLISKTLNVDEDIAAHYYSIAIEFTKQKIIRYTVPTDRICNKGELVKHLKSSRKSIFYSSFATYKGYQRYKQFVISNVISSAYNEEIAVIFNDKNDNVDSICECVSNLLDIRFKSRDLNRGSEVKPLTFVFQEERIARIVKKYLINMQEWDFNDGYIDVCFSIRRIEQKAIAFVNTNDRGRSLGRYSRISYHCRILSMETNVEYSKFSLKHSYLIGQILDNALSGLNPILIQGVKLSDIAKVILKN